MRWIVLLLLGAGVAFGGAKLYLWYQVREGVETLVRGLRAFAAVEYEGIHTSLLDSSVGVDGITIHPRMIDDGVAVERVRFRAPNLMFLYDAQAQIDNGRLPDGMGIAVDGLTLNTHGPLFARLLRSMRRSAPAALSVPACGPVSHLSPQEFRDMGYRRLALNLAFDYEVGPAGERLTLRGRAGARDMADLRYRMEFVGEDLGSLATYRARPRLKLADGGGTYEDAGYNRRLLELCTMLSGASSEAFVAARVRRVAAELERLGIDPDDRLLTAYRDFADSDGRVAVELDPRRPIGNATFDFYNPAYAVAMLRPSVRINGRKLDVSALESTGERLITELEGEPARQPSDEAGDDEANGPEPVPPRALIGEKGEWVRLVLTDGSELRGRIDGHRNGALLIEAHVHGGTMVRPVQLARIESAYRVDRW